MSDEQAMQEDQQNQENGTASPPEFKQDFELYIKASVIDRVSRGSCPICHQWFMIAYLMAERQPNVNFKVFTVTPDAPPKFMIDNGWSRKFPVVRAKSCRDKAGHDISGMMYDTTDELELFFDSVNEGHKQLKRNNQPNVDALKATEDIYNQFNHYMNGKPEANLIKTLKNVDDFLDEHDSKFLLEDDMCFADCYLLPRLQHVRVAGKAYRDFDIPQEFNNVWRYLMNAYETKAFTSTMPSDEEIIVHYENKFPNAKKVKKPKEGEDYHFTTDIPPGCATERSHNDAEDSN